MHVLPSAMIYTDEFSSYTSIGRNFVGHVRVNHSAGVYVDGGASTNSIEGFFGLLKTGIRGVYHSVSAKYCRTTWTSTHSATTAATGVSLFFGRSSTGYRRAFYPLRSLCKVR